MNGRCNIGLVAVLTLLIAGSAAAVELPQGPCGAKAPGKAQRRKGGEGVPPLPLPATPQRRTEKKRPPSPPPLAAKIAYGGVRTVEREGKTVKYHDWNKDPGDLKTLLNMANKELNFRYSSKRGPLKSFPTDPARYPVYYYTGSHGFSLSDAQVSKIRKFVRSGGTVWGDACFGNPDFFKAFIKQMSKVFPGREFRRLPPRHPVYHCFYDIENVRYTRSVPDVDGKKGPPVLYGLEVGCRTPIIVSRYDLSCGWSGHVRKGSMAVHPSDARKVGLNLICYTLGTYRVGRYQGQAKIYYEKNKEARGDFMFVQASVGDNWNTQPNAIANLMKAVSEDTSVKVTFRRNTVDLTSSDLQKYPFLYLTGHHDFQLSEQQVKALRRYLESGGFLLASACCGKRGFDAAFREQISRVLPGNKLSTLSRDHAVYSMLHDIEEVDYSEYAGQRSSGLPPLPLEGVKLGGTTPVIYSRYGLGGGWRGFEHPFARDVAPEDAMNLGVNIVLYAMTH